MGTFVGRSNPTPTFDTYFGREMRHCLGTNNTTKKREMRSHPSH
jgi:hypothetical protein